VNLSLGILEEQIMRVLNPSMANLFIWSSVASSISSCPGRRRGAITYGGGSCGEWWRRRRRRVVVVEVEEKEEESDGDNCRIICEQW